MADSIFSKGRSATQTGNIPRNAATVILLRDRADGSYEVFLMRRHKEQAFMGGAFVFPGGHLDDADTAPDLASCISGLCGAQARRLLQEPELTATKALGLFLTAIRETFEEAGVLLARDASGHPVSPASPDAAARFTAYRLELHEGRLTLADLAKREEILYAPDLLMPYSHWITPEIEARRFNTRFFLAPFPKGQVADHDRMELTESRWMTPASALAAHHSGRIVLMPPTLKTIEELKAFSCTEELLTATRLKRIDTTFPEIFRTADSFGIRLPHDREYSSAEWKQQPRPGETTRIVMQNGIWKSFSV
jgi:8-oxo-dGTP pyrophosphatase MutT (NUDIX family)